MEDTDGLSAYELERLENMRRNAAHLESLGIDARPPAQPHKPAARKRPRPKQEPTTAPPTEVRRSSRQRVATTIYSDETPLSEPRRGAAYSFPSGPYEGPDEPLEDDDAEEDKAASAARAAAALAARPPPEKDSARAIKLDVPAILSTLLGKPIPGAPTKASAVDAITMGTSARFSKYAGALEWKNAIVLWVNVGGSDYKNLFSAKSEESSSSADGGGLTMTWYASERNSEETPIVQRLIAGRDAVLLFCRVEKEGRKEPYVCCGKLGYVSHVPRRQPLKFVWRLEDAEGLKGQEAWEEVIGEARRGL